MDLYFPKLENINTERVFTFTRIALEQSTNMKNTEYTTRLHLNIKKKKIKPKCKVNPNSLF